MRAMNWSASVKTIENYMNHVSETRTETNETKSRRDILNDMSMFLKCELPPGRGYCV